MASHRRSPQPAAARVTPLARAAVGAVGAAAATAASLASAPVASADPDRHPQDVKTRVDRLYEQAESATEKYNGAREREKSLRERLDDLRDKVAREQGELNRLRGGLGSLATAQYRGGAIDPALRLMLSSDPDDYLERASALDRVSSRGTGELRLLERTRRALAQQRAEAAGKLEDLGRTRADLARHKRAVQGRLAKARRLLNRLDGAQRAALGYPDGRGADRASRSDRAVLPLPGGLAPASPRAALAVAAARRALGAPYVWASAGPVAFDCSGLTYWAYRQAGVTLPRTSQGQLHAGRQVPLAEARPGDLVVYRSDASHVAMYMGNGQVIHAPHPGAYVRYDPVGMMPVAGVTRV